MNRRTFRSFRSWALTGVAAAAIASPAYAQEARRFEIPGQSLIAALEAFGKQGDAEILFSKSAAEGRSTQGLTGEYEPSQALALLLEGSGLKYRQVNANTYVVEAQDPQGGRAAGASTVEALIVTAQKREEDIQDVPIAISAFSQEDLTRSQVAGGPDLMTQVPNMTFTKTNFASYSIQLRGIGTQAISATVDPAVAVAFNNTPFVRNRFFEQEFYDLQRVEVLRGPQGTLYGRNATAGVVNLISQKPRFSYEAKVSGDVANYNSTRLEGMINLPLVEDAVALRLAGAWTKREGFVTNEITGNPIDGRDLWSTRLSLRFSPTDRIDANLIWEHFEEDDDRLRSGKQLCKKHIVTEVAGVPIPSTPESYGQLFPGAQATYYQSQLSQGCIPNSLYAPDSFETPNGFQFGFYHPIAAIGLPTNPDMNGLDPYVSVVQSRDLRVIESTVDPSYRAEADTVELQISYDLSDTLTLSSETAWATDYLFSTQDYNRFNTRPGAWAQTNARPGVLKDGVFCDPQVGCSDRLVLVDLIHSEASQFSQELRLASDYDGPFNFSIGANFMRGDSEDKYYVFINSLTLWGAGAFASHIPTEYVGGQSDNRECQYRGLEPVPQDEFGGVGTAGSCLYIDPNPIGSLNDQGHNYFLSRNPYKLISYAAFGEAYYNLTDNLKLTAGLRWTVDKKEAPRVPSWLLARRVGHPVRDVVEQEWREPTGRLTVDWKPELSFTDDTLLYASYAHGYKAGGANPPTAGIVLNIQTAHNVPTISDTHPLTFEAEYIDAFELGAKNTLLDGRVTANLAAFYYDYKGYQLSQIVDRSAITKNFDADIWGLEIEADWRPLENLRFGFKGGYQDTKVADGMNAVDVMDRSNGNQLDYVRDGNGDFLLDGNGDPIPFQWIVVKPFPVYPSNCIVPSYLSVRGGSVGQIGNVAGSDNGPCNMAYFEGLDPITSRPYEPNPPPPYSNGGFGASGVNYPGFNPATAPNNGEGISKDLSGNELPNAPHFTATITADYTVPLSSDWLMTLHTDLYYQSEAWTRIFNTEGYDKLKAYSNVNLAAIFTNDMAGWKVMAYVKNVMDRDAITGAFLNSDDSGLTTNVFLTEPRLYGIRVTKEFRGGPWWTGANPGHTGPYPLTVELSGQVQRVDAPYETFVPGFMPLFSEALQASVPSAQNRDLDWGDGREVKLTWRPDGAPWLVSTGVRYGRANGGNVRLHTKEEGFKSCFNPAAVPFCDPESPSYAGPNSGLVVTETNWTDNNVVNREEYSLVDFEVGHDVGLGLMNGGRSLVSVGLRYAQFKSKTDLEFGGADDWTIPQYWTKYNSSYDSHRATFDADREFKGVGAMLSWEASQQLLGGDDVGHIDLDWSLSGGALFGKQKTSIIGEEVSGHWTGRFPISHHLVALPDEDPPVSIDTYRERSVTVPVIDVSLGLSYEIQRLKVSTGYRWERYYDALDGGVSEAKKVDRTIDGPYFKLSVGFGGG